MKNVPIARLAAVWLLATAWVVVCGCNQPEPFNPPPPDVTVAKAEQEDIVDVADFTGTTKETESMELRARVQGFLKSINFVDGSRVNKGDLLFVIEQEPFIAKKEEAEARLASAKAKYDLSKVNLTRSGQLFERGVIAREEYDMKVAQRDVSRAAVLEAQAALDQAKIDLGYTEMYAPFSGQISRHLVSQGNLVGAGEHTLLATVLKYDPIWVNFDVGELDLLRYMRLKGEREQNGNKQEESSDNQEEEVDGEKLERVVYMELADQGGFPYRGKIDFIDNTLDSSTGTYAVRAVFSNKPNKNGVIIPPGAFARVRVPGPTIKDAVMVADRAIGTDLTGKYLLVVGKNKKVERRYVTNGPLVGLMRVIEKGIKPGESYVVDGLQRARPGMPVKATPVNSKDQSFIIPATAKPGTYKPKEPSEAEREASETEKKASEAEQDDSAAPEKTETQDPMPPVSEPSETLAPEPTETPDPVSPETPTPEPPATNLPNTPAPASPGAGRVTMPETKRLSL